MRNEAVRCSEIISLDESSSLGAVSLFTAYHKAQEAAFVPSQMHKSKYLKENQDVNV